jgi:iron complex outermembrane recepter protein
MLTTATVRALSATILLVCCLNASPAQAQSDTGSIWGQVTDAATGAPLVGADVLIDGTSHSTATDRSGVFRLAGVPAGQYTLLVLYLGHSDERAEVKVSAGIATSVEVKLAPDRFSEEV